MAFRTPEAAEEWSAIVEAFLQRHVEAAGAKGVMVGMSGGLDSAVVAALAARALGKRAVVPVLMPAPDSNPRDLRDGRLVCRALGLKPLERPIGPLIEGLGRVLGRRPSAVASGNAKARARMTVLYAEAQARGFLVCGTGNKSELLTGYFTKHGDGGVDLQPIGDLYKTQVRELARFLKIPPSIVRKPPSAGLRPGQTDEGELGVTYADLDRILRGIELNQGVVEIVRRTGLPRARVAKVERMVRRTEHKRQTPRIPKVGPRTVGIDWRRSVHWDG
ncbi:MAG TPA: NAD+ synthase [Candidatus Thermoplasmatota archaeon]|nr:NAD+ synthase [Candidatus Thermoplasmatota archaeon]